MKTIGRVHSIETCGTVDGPGIRYVVFLQGCPLRCKYCHNPDTWSTKGKFAKDMSVEELMNDIVKYKSYMKFSGGGITVSGGEPLMHHEFVYKLFKACKEENISTALDTSGFADLSDVKNLLDYTDLVLLDIKSINPDTFKNITYRDIDKTLNFSNYLNEKNIKTWIRFVLVPKLSDNKNEIVELAKYISTLRNVEKIEVLPFHKMGEYKWEELNLKYTLSSTEAPSKEEVESITNIFESYKLCNA